MADTPTYEALANRFRSGATITSSDEPVAGQPDADTVYQNDHLTDAEKYTLLKKLGDARASEFESSEDEGSEDEEEAREEELSGSDDEED
jgi:hypothetical protein